MQNSIPDVCDGPVYPSGNTVTGKITKCKKECESKTGEECKTKMLQCVKVQHEIVQYI